MADDLPATAPKFLSAGYRVRCGKVQAYQQGVVRGSSCGSAACHQVRGNSRPFVQGKILGSSAGERMLAAAIEPATVLAVAGCAGCHGTGERLNGLCACVLRGVFEDCYRRFRICARATGFERRVSFPMVPGRDRRRTWERRTENYLCDFALAARRVLGQETTRGRIFRWRYLCGATVEMVLERINREPRLHGGERPMSRRALYEMLGKMEARLGEEYLTLKPHSLWPTWKYFGQ